MIDLAEHSSNCCTEKRETRAVIRMIELHSRHLKQLRTVKGCSHDDNCIADVDIVDPLYPFVFYRGGVKQKITVKK